MLLTKVVPPVVHDEDPSAKPYVGPLVVMSGFLTKKNRTLNRWRQRWWQLLDNGMLYYYNNDDRSKQLGQINIAHSCYDVKLGSENCRISFPRVAPSCCCLSFTVLKRSYYLYAPTAAEAKKWAESIKNASRVLNRKLVAGVERRKAPAPPGPPRPPSCPPNMRINRNSVHRETLSVFDSLDDSLEMSLQPSRTTPRFAANMKMASSVPDFLDRVGYSPSRPAMKKNPNDRLWLDGSPYPITTSTFGQTFPSPPASYTGDVMTSTGSLSISVPSSPTSASSTTKNTRYFQLEQVHGSTTFQQRQNSQSNSELRTDNRQSGSGGRRVVSRNMLKNRCSLPIIFERSHEQDDAESIQHHRPVSCVPNPVTSSTAKSIEQIKPHVRSVTRVPVFPGVIMGTLQKKDLNRNLARNKQTYPRPLPRNRARAQSTSNHLDNEGTAYRPVPKPRRSKATLIDQDKLPGLERTMSCDFIASTNDWSESTSQNTVARILQATSPTESERSVSIATSRIFTSVVSPRRKAPPPPNCSGEHTPPPPPRPKRDSGPPTFIPPPPPVEELDCII